MNVDAVRVDVHCDCSFCGEEYLVEPDAFGDGGVTYYVGFLGQREAADDR